MAILQPQQHLKYDADSLFSLSIGEQGDSCFPSYSTEVFHCLRPTGKPTGSFCSVLLLTNYFFNVQQQKMLPPQIQTANQALSCYLIRTSIFVKLLISVNPFYCWITSKSFLKFKPGISYCTTAASFHFFKTCIFSTQDSAC